MERIKVLALVSIAIALVRIAFGPAVHDAQAAGEAIQCEAFYADQVNNLKKEKSLESSRAYIESVRPWLEAHPGAPVFRTTLVNQSPLNRETLGYIDIICVK